MKPNHNAKQRLKNILNGKRQPVSQYPNLTFGEAEELDELRRHSVSELSDSQLNRLRYLITRKRGSSRFDNLTEEESQEFYALGTKAELDTEERKRFQMLLHSAKKL